MLTFKGVYEEDKLSALTALALVTVCRAVYYGLTFKLISAIPLEYSIPLMTSVSVLTFINRGTDTQ